MIYLFSIDVEDNRPAVENVKTFQERVYINIQSYLNWLKKYNFKCTFFIVGQAAQMYPFIIPELLKEGHEIACHGQSHIPLDKMNKDDFRRDIEKNLNALHKAGASEIKGFRAPVFSLISSTKWAYEVLYEMGFSYSSSVLPARNPLYGWENFGEMPKKVDPGIIELPMTLAHFGLLKVPAGGGIYFRVLPEFFISWFFNKRLNGDRAVLGYFHPYDIDSGQEKFMHPGINDNKIYNWLIYLNRSKVFDRLDHIIQKGCQIITYKEYIEKINI